MTITYEDSALINRALRTAAHELASLNADQSIIDLVDAAEIIASNIEHGIVTNKYA